MKKILLPAIAACLLTVSTCRPDDAAEQTPQTYSISGTVGKSDGGAADGASVLLINTSDGSDAGQTSAGATGEYIITGISAGNYRIIITLDGYETSTADELKIINTDVTANEIILQKITTPTYTISGAVTKPDGRAAADVSVQIRRAGDNAALGQATTTGASGEYAITGVPSGAYNIIFTLEGYEAGLLNLTVENADLADRNITLQPVTENADAISILFSGNEATVGNLPADGSVTATQNGAHVTIETSAAGTVAFHLSGSTANGSLKIQNNATAPNTLRLTLNSAAIASASKLPPLQITKNEGITIVELKGNSLLSDNAANEENAALISKSGSLRFEGYGRLTVSGAARHAIASSKKEITVSGGDITVTAAASDGFHAGTGFIHSGGSLDITASGDGIDAGSGTADLSGGNIRIHSSSDDVKGIKADAGVTVSGGTIAMTVSGAQSKGIGSKADITVSGGDISIVTSGVAALVPAGSGYDPSYCTAVKSDQNITVTGGNIQIESLESADGGKGLSADGDIRIRGGDIRITTAGNGKVYTSETGSPDSYASACIRSDGNIALLSGKITCHSSGTGGKCIHAVGTITLGVEGANNAALTLTVGTSGERFPVSAGSGGGQGGGRPGFGGGFGGFGDNGTDYANPKAIKSEGDITVHSGTITVNCTQQTVGGEGMESKSAFTVHGGAINIRSYDDCINGGTSVTINGGSLFVAARGQDAIDSNGTLTFNGGLTVANGVRGDGEAFDGQTGRYTVNGGILVGTSGRLMETPGGPQRALIYSRASVGGDICVRNAAGENLLLFRVPVISGAVSGTNVIVVFSDPRLTAGTYALLYGGVIEGGVSFNGYVTGGSYSGGSSKAFTVGSSAYTHVQ
jgi:hypothetical protein